VGGAGKPGVADLRSEATATLKDCEGRWSDFRKNGGLVLNDQLTRSFKFLTDIIETDSTPTEWFKDGLAIFVGYYSGVRKLYQYVHKLYPYYPEG
jgi:hypothetical protein